MIRNYTTTKNFARLYGGMTSFTRSLNSLREWRYDCTGRAVLCSEENLGRLNHILGNILTGNEKYCQLYDALIQAGEGGILTLSLALIDKSRSSIRGKLCSLTRQHLRQRLIDEEIEKEFFREKYLAAAALHWDSGNHLQAAGLLETLISKVGTDTLVSKLAQEAYILAGQSENALGCLIRHPASYNAADPFNVTVVGLTSVGYLENGKLPEAEESAKRAVAMSGGRDLVSLLALLDCYHLTGKSSDMLEMLNNYEPLHAYDMGKYFLLCRKASAQIMRGNCNGGFKSLHQVFETQITNKFYHPLDIEEYPLQLLVESGILLWQIIMNLDSRHVIALDQVIEPFNMAVATIPDEEPLKLFLQSIVLCANLHSLESKNATEYLSTRKAAIMTSTEFDKTTKTSVWNPLTFFRSEVSDLKQDHIKSLPKSENSSLFSEEVQLENTERVNSAKKSIRVFIQDIEKSECEKDSLDDRNFDIYYGLKSELPFLFDSTDKNKKSRLAAIRSISKAVLFFGLRDYQQAVHVLSPLHRNSYRSVGLAAPQRDAIWQMFIES